jgi:WD40 repeat protein
MICGTFYPPKTTVYSISEINKSYNIEKIKEIFSPISEFVEHVSFSPDDKYIIMSDNKKINIIDAHNLTIYYVITLDVYCKGISFNRILSAEGYIMVMFVCDYDKVKIYDLQEFRMIRKVYIPHEIKNTVILSNGKDMITSTHNNIYINKITGKNWTGIINVSNSLFAINDTETEIIYYDTQHKALVKKDISMIVN